MASCKECFHYRVCMDYTSLKESEWAQNYPGSDIICEHYKSTADVVEVVRCKDCNHCEMVIDQFENDWYFCKKTKDNTEVRADDYCSYGTPKERDVDNG